MQNVRGLTILGAVMLVLAAGGGCRSTGGETTTVGQKIDDAAITAQVKGRLAAAEAARARARLPAVHSLHMKGSACRCARDHSARASRAACCCALRHVGSLLRSDPRVCHGRARARHDAQSVQLRNRTRLGAHGGRRYR